jgi:hypothetical protein
MAHALYTGSVSLQVRKKKKKKKKKAKKQNAIKVFLSTDEQAEDAQNLDRDDDGGGIYLEKEDVLLIYNALKNYKPGTVDEEMTSEMLTEQFEEILIVDYKVKLPGVKW